MGAVAVDVAGTQEQTRTPVGTRWDGLDGMRALAVGLVLATHFKLGAPDGQVGVDVFFVISGFLITSLLLREHDRTETVSLPNFWKRRALRLFPALGCAIAVALVVSLFATPHMRSETLAGLPFVLLYVGNWAKAFGNPQALGLLVHTWSLAVEEQFYLVWPLVCVLWLCRTANRARAALLVGALAVADSAYMVMAMNRWDPVRTIFSTDTHAMGLLAGSALALWIARTPHVAIRQGRSARSLQIWGAISLVLILEIAVTFPMTQTRNALQLIAGTAAATVLIARFVLAPGGLLTRFFSARPMVWVGRRSYGIYLYHFPFAVVFVQMGHLHGWLEEVPVTVACLGGSLILAGLSYRFVETPFLRRKVRFSTEPDVALSAT